MRSGWNHRGCGNARRALRAYFGVGVLMFLAAVSAPTALGATASLEWDPPTFDFGPVPYASGPSEPHEFTLTNTGETQLKTAYWRSRWLSYWTDGSDPFWTTSSTCHVLEPGESCSIEMVFDPLHPGIWRGWQEVRSQIEGEPWAELELSGEGTGPWAPLTPEHLVFESVAVGMTTAPQTITLESQDHEEFTIADISFTQVDDQPLSSAPFQVVGGSCHEGELLGPGETCTIEVAMAPTRFGVAQSQLEITDGAPGSPQTVELEGTATVPADNQLVTPPLTITPQPPLKRACPKGKRKVVKKGYRTCVKIRRHHRHRHHR